MSSDTANRITDRVFDIDGQRLVVAWVAAILPSLGVLFEVGIATREPRFWHLIVAMLVFTALLYDEGPRRNVVASMLFYLALLAAILPVAVFAGAVDQNMNVIVGGMFTLVAAVVGFGVGAVLYLVSGRVRIEPDSED